MSRKPSTLLHAVVESVDGAVFRYDAFTRDPENRLLTAKKSSRMMEGYAGGAVLLPRGPSVNLGELGPYGTLKLYLDDGDQVYESRIAAPEADSATQRVSVECASWMSHGRDRPMPPYIYRDADRSAWKEMSAARKIYLESLGIDAQAATTLDGDTGGVVTRMTGAWDGVAQSESWYNRLPARIGFVRFPWRVNSNVNPASASWLWLGTLEELDSGASGGVTTGDLQPSGGTGSVDLVPTGINPVFASVVLQFATAGGVTGTPYEVIWQPVVYGPHDLPELPNGGLRVSDMIKHSAAMAAPLLDTSGIADTEFEVMQALIPDLLDPYDFWVSLNKYELRNLAVWDDRKMTYDAIDDSDADWYVRRADPNVRVKFDGPNAGAQANGIMVRFQNIENGRADLLTPSTNLELADNDPRLAANRLGVDAWESVTLPDPDTPEGASRYGQLALARFNAQARGGKITIKGHVQDAAGAWHPVSKIRVNDTILVADEPGEVPRVIYEEDYDYGPDVSTLTVNRPSQDADAILDSYLTSRKRSR